MAINNKTLHLEHFQIKHKLAANWPANYILSAGEIGLESDTKKYKLGDGTTAWSELAYYKNPVVDELITSLTSRVTQTESDITELKSSVTDLTTRVGQNESDITGLKSSATDLTTRVGQNESDIAGLKSSTADLTSRVEAIEGITEISVDAEPAAEPEGE